MTKKLKEILKKHEGHKIAVWENNDWEIKLDQNGKVKSCEIGGSDGAGVDTQTPLYCIECGEELEQIDEHYALMEEAIAEK